MKKMTFVAAALLGATYFSNAQVGIGTSTPADAAQLEISAGNKGVLIPRVTLRNTSDFGPINGTQVESLLVYNTAAVADVTPGFYYWTAGDADANPVIPAHWERIVNQTQLDEAIENITDLQGDVSKILALLKVAFPSNNLVDPSVDGDTHGGGMVFIPGATPTIEYVYFNGTDYVKKDITGDIIDIIKGNETKTFFRRVVDANGNAQYLYFSEEAIQNWLAADDDNTVTNIPDSAAAITLDVVGDVVNNFESILNQTTEYKGDEITIEKIIQEIASQVEGNVIYKNIAEAGDPANWVFQYWDGTKYETIELGDLVKANETKTKIVTIENKQFYLAEDFTGTVPTTIPATLPTGMYAIDVVGGIINNFEEFVTNNQVTVDGDTYDTVEKYIQYISQNSQLDGDTKIVINATTNQASLQQWDEATKTWVDVANSAFKNIVTANETETTLVKNEEGAVADGDVEISYDYFNETSEGTPQASIDLNGDILNLIEGNTLIQNAITKILNDGGNVYYGDHDGDGDTPDVFYTIVNGVKTPIDITGQVLTVIENNKEEIKTVLGDNFENTTVVKTGDTWIDGGAIYKGIFGATVTKGSANVSAITLTAPSGTTVGDVIGIKILNATTNQIINTATTDVVVTGGELTFKIGSGNMFVVLPEATAADFNIKVMVEYSAPTTTP